MSRAKLSAAANHFFDRILPAVTQKHLSELTNAEVLLGAYRRHTGGPIQTSFGPAVTPEFMLKVSKTKAPLQNGLPVLGDAPLPADATNQPLVWMQFAADAKVDDQATIQDLMGDLDTYAQKKFSLAGINVELPADTPAPPNSQQWAQTLAANRAAIPDNLAAVTEVPTALQPIAATVTSLKLILSHFFTYDAKGLYYPRWKGTGRNIPQDLSDVYKQNNVRELKLSRDEMYVYMLAPKSLFTKDTAEAHDYREIVIRLDETGDPTNPFMPTLVHSVYKRMADNVKPFHDFIFFETEDGVGINVQPAVRTKMSAQLIQFLLALPDVPADRTKFLQKSHYVLMHDPPLVNLSAIVSGPVQLPAGVIGASGETGGILSILSPVDKIVELAALPGVTCLLLTGFPYKPTLNLARPAIDHDTFRAKYPADKQDGAGVLIGVIDSGIDGTHRAFNDSSGKSRIVAVWDQSDIKGGSPNSPAKKHPTDKAYKVFDFGRELTGADVSLSTDSDVGHGTHVTGIAAGAEVSDPSGVLPRGIAPKAKIVVVKAIEIPTTAKIDLALQYIFLKATELKMPCVVNMSFGGHGDAHDGTDQELAYIADLIHDPATKDYRPGRVICAAAGNERDEPIHVRRDVAKGNSTVIQVQTRTTADHQNEQFANMWIRSTTQGPKPNLRVTVTHAKTGWTTGAITPTASNKGFAVGKTGMVIYVAYADQDPRNKDYNLIIDFDATGFGPDMPTEDWNITVTNSSDLVELHGWALLGAAFKGLVNADNSVKVGAPANSPHVITVASTNTRLSWPDIDKPTTTRNSGGRLLPDGTTVNPHALGDLSGFSSPGPLRACSELLFDLFFFTLNLQRPAIDVAAPGSAIQSALAKQVVVTKAMATAAGLTGKVADDVVNANRASMMNNISWVMEGTSMATPLVTGIVACMLAAEPNLTLRDVRQRIRAAAKLPAAAATSYKPGAPDPDDWGPGLLNAPALKP